MAKVLVIGDLHLPYVRPGYLEFCVDLYKQQKCDATVFIGDVCDFHAISFHQTHPDAPGPSDEISLAKTAVQQWYKKFPSARVCVGNHDARIFRLAATVKIPESVIRTLSDIFDTPGWEWKRDFVIDKVFYMHGTGCSGLFPAYNTMRKMAMPVVQGHNHTAAGIKYLVNHERRLFGMDVGCGIADDAVQFLYAENNPIRSVISAATVCDGLPQLWIMPCGKGEKYHDSNFKRKK
jgi:predicted phosphodiesterase